MDRLREKRLDDEIRHHIEERVARLVAGGMDRDEAEREAVRAFGDVGAVRTELERIEEPPRGALRLFADRARRDLSFSLRQMRRNPGFASIAILTLALGIGSATAIFGLVKAVVLDPLPYPAADRLVTFNEVAPDGARFSVAAPDYLDFRERTRSLEHLTAVGRADVSYVDQGRPVNLVAGMVTGDFFPLFGAQPLMGRTFADQEPGPDPAAVVVLGHAFWADHLGADPDVVGRNLVLDDRPYEVVGVMPSGWDPLSDSDLWLPIPLTETDRTNHDLAALARIAPGATLESARADVRAVAAELEREFPATNRDWSAMLRPLKESLVGQTRIQAGWVLLGAVGLLLLLACASVSNLLLARASSRGREMDLRLTLGAGRGPLLQQLFTESLTLAAAGAALGLLLANVLLPVLKAMSPADTPRIAEASLDPTVVLVALGVALLTSLVFGTAPVLHVLRRSRSGAARAASGGSSPTSERARAALVAAQVAVSLTLLFGTGALAASFVRLQSTDTGMDVDHTLVVPLMLSGDRYSSVERATTSRALHERLAALPGVTAVGTTNIIPFSGGSSAISLNVEGRPSTPETAPWVRWRAVSPGWFEAAGTELLQGRTLRPSDDVQGAEDVVVVTRTLATNLFGDPASAIGKRLGFGWDGTNWRRVVGVIDDFEDLALATTPPATLIFPSAGAMNWAIFLVRYRPGAALADAGAIRRAIWDVDPMLPVPSVERLSQRVDESVASPRFNLLVMSVFGGVALVLSLMAIYGLVLFGVRRRTREIGVRIALGARPDAVVGLLLRRGMVITGAGIVAGVLLSGGLSRFLDALLFGSDSFDVGLLAVAALTVGAAATVATWVPARRATRVDPREALGAE